MHKTARTASTTTFSFSFSSAEVCITIDLLSIEIVKVILFSSLTFRRNLILIAMRPLSLLEGSCQMPCNSEGSKYAQARKFKGLQVKSRVQKLFFKVAMEKISFFLPWHKRRSASNHFSSLPPSLAVIYQ